ncbi:hypothetical protein TWF694_000380 [Orbilia ellipsospora]|uniref:LAGLIDADG endonuclease n=1 Tax=Orbilia ellipsospora TaxID=2528407 RepID=A0AAV9XRT0_9PEZI
MSLSNVGYDHMDKLLTIPEKAYCVVIDTCTPEASKKANPCTITYFYDGASIGSIVGISNVYSVKAQTSRKRTGWTFFLRSNEYPLKSLRNQRSQYPNLFRGRAENLNEKPWKLFKELFLVSGIWGNKRLDHQPFEEARLRV